MSKPTTLVEILAEQAHKDAPTYEDETIIGVRKLTITVYAGDYQTFFHLAGAKGGSGDLIPVPNELIISLASYLTGQHAEASRMFDEDALYNFHH
jgi:hypothetical protein